MGLGPKRDKGLPTKAGMCEYALARGRRHEVGIAASTCARISLLAGAEFAPQPQVGVSDERRIMDPATPRKIDKYEVVGLIARGGMGVVYKALDRSLDRFVAIKMVTNADEEHGELLKRFYREARFTANLRHPNIVTVFDLGDFGGTPYLVMEYLSGKSLDSTLEEEWLSLQQKLNCIGQVCNGLQYAHAHQPSIIHRDIKPANIVVAQDGRAKIIDFGIACLGQSRNTRTGLITGSYHYMSPEQISGAELDGRSDIFSTGVVLYQLLTRTLPFAGNTIAETLQQVIANTPPPLNQFLKEYPSRLDHVLAQALAKNRADRYQTASEFALDLTEIEEELKRGFFGSYLERAEAFLTEGEYERAKQEIVRVLDVDSQHERANDLMRKVQRANARRQRKTRALNLRVRAEEALKLNRLDEAMGYLDQAVKLDATNAELHAFREQVSAIRERAKRVHEILARAERACAADDLVEANRAVAEALLFDPDSARARSFQAILDGKKAGRETNYPAQGPPSAPSNEARQGRHRGETAQLPETGPDGAGRWRAEKGLSAEAGPIWSDEDVTPPSSRPETNVGDAPMRPEQRVAPRAAMTPGMGGDDVTAAFEVFDAACHEVPEKGAGARNLQVSEHPPLVAPLAGSVEHSGLAPKEQPAAKGLPEDIMRAAEKQLAGFIGALAKVVVKKAASRTTNADHFYRLLAASIAGEKDRAAFLSAVGRRGRSTQSAIVQPALPVEVPSGPQSSEAELTAAAVERAARLLAQYLGPLSGMLTRRAAQRAHNLRAFYLLLAEHISKQSDRDQFLQDAGFPDL